MVFIGRFGRFIWQMILRVLTGRALPGWFAVLVGAADWISRIQLLGSAGSVWKSIWGFLTTPSGNALLLISGFMWIFISSFLIPPRRTPVSLAPPSAPQALYEFWARRSDGPRIPDVFKDVQEAWVAWINSRSIRSSMDLRDTHITRMILLHPDADDIDAIARSEGRPREELAAEIRGVTSAAGKIGMAVKWFRGPIVPLIIGNPNTADAWVKGDLVSLYVQPDDRPSIRVRDPNVVRVVREMHQHMWHDAEMPSSAGALPREEQRVQLEHLVEIAGHDDANMQKLIHFLRGFAQTIPHLNAPDPYVDLEFGFINASAFDLTYRRVIGSVSYQGEPFRNALTLPEQVVSATAFIPIVIRHGEQSVFTLRQWVSHATAQQILAEIQRSGIVVLDTRPIAVCFAYTNHLGGEKEACVGIPDMPYEITQAA